MPMSASGIGNFVSKTIVSCLDIELCPVAPESSRSRRSRCAPGRPVRAKRADPSLCRESSRMGSAGIVSRGSGIVRAHGRGQPRTGPSGPGAGVPTPRDRHRGFGHDSVPQARASAQLGTGSRIEPAPVEAVSEPPSRVFRFRLRPTRPGNLVIPPVAIAAFDPKLRRYMTKVSPSVAVQVVDVPRFDPSRLEYDPPPLEDSSWSKIIVAVVSEQFRLQWVRGSALRLRHSTRQHRSRLAAQRSCTRLLRDVDRSLTPSEAARRLTEGLAEYLHVIRAAAWRADARGSPRRGGQRHERR